MSADAFGNNLSGLFETLVAGSTAAAAAAAYNNPMLVRCYNGFESTYGSIGNTIDINIPIVNESNVTNIGSGPIAPVATNQNTVPLQIAYNASTSRRLPSFDQIRTPANLRKLYLDAMLEEVMRYTDNILVQVAMGNAATVSAPGITAPTNTNSFFSVNQAIGSATIAGTTPGAPTVANEFTRMQLGQAWATVIGQGGMPTQNNASFICNQVPFGNMLSDVNLGLIQAYVVGLSEAEKAQQTAKFAPFLNSIVDYDQHFGSTGSSPATPTGQTTAPPANKQEGLYFHRYAMAFNPVIQVPTGSPVCIEITVYPRPDLPVRIQIGYDMFNQCWMVHANTIFAAGVIRPEWGVVVYGS